MLLEKLLLQEWLSPDCSGPSRIHWTPHVIKSPALLVGAQQSSALHELWDLQRSSESVTFAKAGDIPGHHCLVFQTTDGSGNLCISVSNHLPQILFLFLWACACSQEAQPSPCPTASCRDCVTVPHSAGACRLFSPAGSVLPSELSVEFQTRGHFNLWERN